jgi:acetylornithine deacetylase
MTDYLSQTIAMLDDLIAFPTVTDQSNLEMVAYLAERLEDAGAKIDLFYNDIGDKANLFATLGPDVDGGFVLSGHCDVVPVVDQVWASDPFDMVERDEKLFGRGTCDMKGFVAAATVMAPYFATKVKDRPVHFSFTYDEETGCFGAQDLVGSLTEKGVRPTMALVGEPTMMQVIDGHKGCYEYTTHFKGLAGHGSAPDLGVNAVEFGTRYISKILELKEELKTRAPKDSGFVPPWTTFNTGYLKGGSAHNVIPDHASVAWDMRPVQASDAHFVKTELEKYSQTVLLPQMQAVYPEAEIVTEILSEVDGFEPMAQNPARDLIMELTGANGTDLVAFGTEAGLFQQMGMSVVICGPGSIEQAHKANEFVAIDQLQQCLDLLERLGERL